MKSLIFYCFNLSLSVSTPPPPPRTWFQFVLHFHSVRKVRVSKKRAGRVYAFRPQTVKQNDCSLCKLSWLTTRLYSKQTFDETLMLQIKRQPDVLINIGNKSSSNQKFMLLPRKRTSQRFIDKTKEQSDNQAYAHIRQTKAASHHN